MDCVDAGVSVAVYPMDRAQPELVRVEFDRRLTLELHGSKIPSDAELPTYPVYGDRAVRLAWRTSRASPLPWAHTGVVAMPGARSGRRR